MLTFLAGLFIGSFGTLVIMSLMYAAKNGDRQMEKYIRD